VADAGRSELTYFEDLTVGQRFGGATFTVDRDEMLEFAHRWDPRPIHVDRDAAVRDGFPDVIATGSFTTAIYTLMIMRAREADGNHATLAVVSVTNKLPNPVLAGDVLRFDAEIADKRESRSRPTAGIVITTGRLTNARGDVVFDSETVTLVHRRPT
jgi:acyl dehydratase